MFTKFLAAAATLLLAAGISVIAIAAPAEAHHTDITASAACTTDGGWDITWKVVNSENLDGTITASDNTAVPVGTALPANPYYYSNPSKSVPTVFTQHVTKNSAVSLAISVKWSNNATNSQGATFNSFPAACGTTEVTPVQPKVVAADACGVTPSVTAETTTGVVYDTQFDPKTGDYTVTATPAKGYVFKGDQVVKYTGNTKVYYDCITEPKPVAVVGQCIYQADGTATQRDVSITFDNSTSNTPVLFQVAGYPQFDKTVAAYDTATVVMPKADAAGASYTVTAAGKSFTLVVAECPPYTKPTPQTRDEVKEVYECAADEVVITTVTYTTDYTFDTTKKEWVKQPEVAGTPVVTNRAPTADEKAAECGVTIKTAPTASACAAPIDLDATYTRWISITPDARVSYSAQNTTTLAVTPLTSAYTEVDAGKYIVTAVAAKGYVLEPASSLTWTFFVEDTDKCAPPTLPIVTPSYSTTPMSCTTAGTYTLGEVVPGTIDWTVDGVPTAEGTYKVSSAATVTLVATPTKTTDGLDPAWVNPIVLTFTAPTGACELETLAFTGESKGSLLTLAGGMVFVGLGGLLIARRRWVATR